VFAILSLWPLRLLAYRMFDRFHERRITVTLAEEAGATAVIERMEGLGIHIEGFSFNEAGDARTVTVVCDLPRGLEKTALIRQLSSLIEVKGAQWGNA
jgi:hypothetical protein